MGILGQKNLGNSRIPRINSKIPRIYSRIHKILLVSLRYKQFSLFTLSFGLLMLDSSYVVLPEELSFILFDFIYVYKKRQDMSLYFIILSLTN